MVFGEIISKNGKRTSKNSYLLRYFTALTSEQTPLHFTIVSQITHNKDTFFGKTKNHQYLCARYQENKAMKQIDQLKAVLIEQNK